MAKIYQFSPGFKVMRARPDFKTGKGIIGGTVGRFAFSAIVSDSPSKDGICGGRILSLLIRDMNGKMVYEYIRGQESPAPKDRDGLNALRALAAQLDEIPKQQDWSKAFPGKEADEK